MTQYSREEMLRSNIDVEKTGWIEVFGKDVIIVHDPVFKYERRHPYKSDQVIAVLCEGGEATGSLNLKPYRLVKDSFLIILAGQIMEGAAQSPDFKGTYLFFSSEFLAGLEFSDAFKFHRNVSLNPCLSLDARCAESLHTYVTMARALVQVADLNPNTGEALRLMTKAFFLMLGWFIHNNGSDNGSAGRASDVITAFMNLVKDGYHEHRDVEYYAERLNISPRYMSTLVRQASGKSALRWIEEYVVLDAKAQLASTSNTVQQIGWSLNFPTQSDFGRYFKRVTGLSPSAYRRSVR